YVGSVLRVFDGPRLIPFRRPSLPAGRCVAGALATPARGPARCDRPARTPSGRDRTRPGTPRTLCLGGPRTAPEPPGSAEADSSGGGGPRALRRATRASWSRPAPPVPNGQR